MAAQQIKVRLKLNLLIPQGVPQKLPIRFLRWLISYGRFIAIMVEIVVLGAFVIRFRYDAQLADLNDTINNKVLYIKSYSSIEAQIRQTQYKLTTIGNTFKQTPDWQGILSNISGQIPPGARLTSIRLDNTQPGKLTFTLSGIALTNTDLAAFVTALKNQESEASSSGQITLKNISLDNVSYQDGQITFTITGGV